MIPLLASVLIASGLIAHLVRAGFRDADSDDEVRVQVRTVATGQATGGWIEATISNPGGDTALAGLTLRRTRPAWWVTPAVARRTGGRRTRIALADQMIGVVEPGGRTRLWMWADGSLRHLRLVVTVGTPGRLRLHRIPLPAPVPVSVVPQKVARQCSEQK